MSFSWWWLRWKDCCSTGRYLRWKHCPIWRYLLLPPNNIWWPVCLFLAQPGSQQIRYKGFNSTIRSLLLFSPDKSSTYPCERENERIPFFSKVVYQFCSFITLPSGEFHFQFLQWECWRHCSVCFRQLARRVEGGGGLKGRNPPSHIPGGIL